MDENNKMDVVVHKANVPLLTGESIDSYTQKLAEKAKEHVCKKLNIVKGQGYAWPMEIYATAVIMSAYKDEEKSKCYAVPYTRKSEGDFEFGETTEVERVTSYRPVKIGTSTGDIKLSKSMKPIEGAPDWLGVQKNIWSGVL